MRLASVLVLACLVLAACGEDVAAPPPTPPTATPSPEPAAPSPEPSGLADLVPEDLAASGERLTGVLGGDGALEGGCTWLEHDGERVEVIYPDGYQATADPLELTGPDGEVLAGGGDEVTVIGTLDPGMATICQVGPVFLAKSVQG